MDQSTTKLKNTITLKELQLLVNKAEHDPSILPKDFSNIDFNNNSIIRLPHLGLASKERFVFNKVDLAGANFVGANLSAVLFKNVNLEGANFTNANLHDVILSNCNIAKANFRGAVVDPSLFLSTTGYQEAIFDNAKIINSISDEISQYKEYREGLRNKSFIANIYGDKDPVISDYLETLDAKLSGASAQNKPKEAALTIAAPSHSTLVSKDSSKQR